MDQRVEDIVVASSDEEAAPEHRFSVILRRELDRDVAVTRLRVCGALGLCFELTDSRQLELLLRLGDEALPRLREAEHRLDEEWRRWREALGAPGTSERD